MECLMCKGELKTGKKYCSYRCYDISKKGIQPKGFDRTGKETSEETRRKLSKSHQGKVTWNKGLNKHNNEVIRKMAENSMGRTPWNKGLRGLPHHPKKYNIKVVNKGWFKKGQTSRENNPNWKGGKSFEEYGIEFTNKLKEMIRNKYNRRCCNCNTEEKNFEEKLVVHHKDSNKMNNTIDNLIILCRKCHTTIHKIHKAKRGAINENNVA